jgi:hypothetical protein
LPRRKTCGEPKVTDETFGLVVEKEVHRLDVVVKQPTVVSTSHSKAGLARPSDNFADLPVHESLSRPIDH